MAAFRFDTFLLDPGDRQLRRDGTPVELNARYLDALTLLVREQGKLVTKDRFLDEVWRGVPVTDEALTQCIKTLRRHLGDDATSPRFIETVPKHGYRFIAAVETGAAPEVPAPKPQSKTGFGWQDWFLLGGAGVAGGGVAGLIGGLVYGLAASVQPSQSGMGAASVLLVLIVLTTLVALVGAIGVSFGIAAAGFAPNRAWLAALGGAVGGLVIGGIVKLLGLDAFNLLFGQAPGGITGAFEGALLGGGVGLGAWLSTRGTGIPPLRRSMVTAGLTGAASGVLIPLLGGRGMAGSLDLLARHFPNSRLRFEGITGLFGEQGFGPISQTLTGALEGGLYGACIVGAMVMARQKLVS